MDFLDMFVDTETKMQYDIESLKKLAQYRKYARLRDLERIESQEARIEQLENHVAELALICRSLVTALRENGTVNPETMMETMIRIDAEDGVVDGKITPPEPPEPPASEEWPKIRTW